jgi:aryl-alcohol dehydrogenase-like predicted oxidoreductase
VVATKVYGEAGPGLPVRGAGRKHIIAAVEASLRRLQTDYIDLYQVHVFDDATPLEETLTTLQALVSSGKVRFIGASNHAGWQLQKAIDLSRHRGLEPYVSLQPLYSLLDRDAELELIPVCRDEGAGVIAWRPLAGGWLSGKYTRDLGRPPAGSRGSVADWQARNTDRTWRVIDALRAVADEARPDTRAGRPAVGDAAPRADSTDHRCTHSGPVGRQSRRDRVGSRRRPDA